MTPEQRAMPVTPYCRSRENGGSMTARSITLRPWQVRAALDGRLRRLVAPLKVRPPDDWRPAPGLVEIHRCDEWGEPVEPRTKRDVLGMGFTEADGSRGFVMPYAPGDTLYGREVWAHVPRTAYAMSDGVEQRLDATDPDMAAVYKAGWERCAPRWRSPVTMLRWASRWTLTVGEVAVIRARDLTETAAIECGTEWATGDHSRKESFASQFDTDHHGAWDRNYWCVSAAVETVAANIGDNR